MSDADKIINPPLIGVSDEQALCAPFTVPEYMAWLADNREALMRNFFGHDKPSRLDGCCPTCGSFWCSEMGCGTP